MRNRLPLTDLEADQAAIRQILNECGIEHSGHLRQAERVKQLAHALSVTRNLAVETARSRNALRNQLRDLGIEPVA